MIHTLACRPRRRFISSFYYITNNGKILFKYINTFFHLVKDWLYFPLYISYKKHLLSCCIWCRLQAVYQVKFGKWEKQRENRLKTIGNKSGRNVSIFGLNMTVWMIAGLAIFLGLLKQLLLWKQSSVMNSSFAYGGNHKRLVSLTLGRMWKLVCGVVEALWICEIKKLMYSTETMAFLILFLNLLANKYIPVFVKRCESIY